MKITIRIPRQIYNQTMKNLIRPHPYAAERVGFIAGKLGAIDDNTALVLAAQYLDVATDQYVHDPLSGARIDTEAIRRVLQISLETGDCMFHVHLHHHRGAPGFSKMDREEIPR